MINKSEAKELYLPDHSSLDAITCQLPGGYYSTFRTHGGCTRVIGLSTHLKRLPDVNDSRLRRNLIQLLEPFRPDEVRVRVMQTRQGQVYVSIEPLKPLSRDMYEKGIYVETTEIKRESPRIKSTAFIGQSDDERKHIAQAGIFEALLVKNGRILEGMTSNFFYILRPEQSGAKSKHNISTAFVATNAPHSAYGEILYTAQRDVLLGVTRRTVIRVARRQGIEVRYSPLQLDQLSTVDEAFITSSSRGIVPVIQIDGVQIGNGMVGMITKQLSAAYEAYVVQKAERI